MSVSILHLHPPAKLNLYLKVLGKRSDGYHELDTLMVPIGLCDDLLIQVEPGAGCQVDCPQQPELEGEDNLVFRAAHAYLDALGGGCSVRATLRKEIPIAAGLGGGSSDAASTLLGLQALLGNPLSHGELHRLALSLGADVPFFLQGRACRARGIGEVLVPVEHLDPFWVVLCIAPFELSTRQVYENLKIPLTSGGSDDTGERSGWSYDELVTNLKNELQSTSEIWQPEIAVVCADVHAAGADGVCMTGSGPTVFGLCRTQADALRVQQRARLPQGWTIRVKQGVPTVAHQL